MKFIYETSDGTLLPPRKLHLFPFMYYCWYRDAQGNVVVQALTIKQLKLIGESKCQPCRSKQS
jgi:hypothetical protein